MNVLFVCIQNAGRSQIASAEHVRPEVVEVRCQLDTAGDRSAA